MYVTFGMELCGYENGRMVLPCVLNYLAFLNLNRGCRVSVLAGNYFKTNVHSIFKNCISIVREFPFYLPLSGILEKFIGILCIKCVNPTAVLSSLKFWIAHFN